VSLRLAAEDGMDRSVANIDFLARVSEFRGHVEQLRLLLESVRPRRKRSFRLAILLTCIFTICCSQSRTDNFHSMIAVFLV
jgi:hypothetical protein